MKTKEQGKVRVPNVRKNAWRPEVRSPWRGGGDMIRTSSSYLLASVSKMKVHPEMFMKTKERGKVRVPNVRKDARRPEVRSLWRAGEVKFLTSGS